MSRNYKKEYDNYHSRPEQKIRRAARNAARRLFADADPDKDVHHKDTNPLNNDKKNLSLVTQYYNRREPRLRKEDVDEANYKIKNGKLHISKKDYAKKSKDYKGKRKGKPTLTALDPKTGATTSFEVVFEEVDESVIVVANEITAIRTILAKFENILQKSDFKKKQKLAKALGIKVSLRGKHRVSVEEVEEAVSHNRLNKIQRDSTKAIFRAVNQADGVTDRTAVGQSSKSMEKSTREFQLHFIKQNSNVKEVISKAVNTVMSKSEIFFLWDVKFAKLLTSFSEDMGTITGPHIAGTGDDSSTVIVKKKKKVYRREALKKRIIDNVLALNKR